MNFNCASINGFQDAVTAFKACDAFQALDHHKKNVVLSIIGDWFEIALDDLVYRQYMFSTDSGLSPDGYIERAKEQGIYREMVYEYAATYPDFGSVSARFVF